MLAVAEAIKQDTIANANAEETVRSTITGQAQEKVQDEVCLTVKGQLFMLRLLADSTIARTYMSIKRDELRTQWLREELGNAGGDLNILFIDWDINSQV
jgi:hypothetical protein